MTKFRFKIEGWHELDAEDEAKYATFSEEDKAKYIEEMSPALRKLMVDEVLDIYAPYELSVEYEEAL